MSTNPHDFINNLINSITKKKQNNDSTIRPALVPDMIPELFASSAWNLNLKLGKQSIVQPHSLREYMNYENGGLDFGYYHEDSSNKLDLRPDENDSESETRATKPMPTPRIDVGVVEKDEPLNTLLSSSSPLLASSPSFPGEIKKHKESADDDDDDNQQETQNKPSSYFSSSEDLKIADTINLQMMHNDINNTLDNKKPLIREKKTDVIKDSPIYANYGKLENRKNDASEENEVGDTTYLPSNLDDTPDKLGSKRIKNSQAKFDRTREGDYDDRQQNYENIVKVKATLPSSEEDIKNLEKSADKDDYYYQHHYLPHPITSNNKGSSYLSSNREEPIINIHIGRIVVRTVSPLGSEEANDYYYNNSQTQLQSTASQNNFQRLSLSDYLKQRAEGKL